MASARRKAWWDEVPPQVGGDSMIVTVGDGAHNVAIGKGITQRVYEVVGEPEPDDKAAIQGEIDRLGEVIHGLEGKVDAGTAAMAEFQLKLLGGELTKIDEGEQPSASTITQVGDWLLDHVPMAAEGLASLFATPAVGKVVGKAGEVAVAWVRGRFGTAA